MKIKQTLSWLKAVALTAVVMGWGQTALAYSPAPWKFEFEPEEAAVGADEIFEKSKSVYEEGDPEGAYKILNRWDGRDDSREAMFWRAWYAGQTGMIDEAEIIFRHLIGEDPHRARYYNALGYMLIVNRYGRLAEAVELLNSALEIEPDSPAILHSYGTALRERGFYSRSRYYYARAVEMLEGDFDDYILTSYGVVLQDLGEYPDFFDLLEDLQGPGDQSPYSVAGNLRTLHAFNKNEADDEILALWSWAADEYPAHARTAVLHAAMLNASGDNAGARREIKRAKSLVTEDPGFFDSFPRVLREIGMIKDLEIVYRGLIKKDPDNPLYYAHLGYLLADERRNLDEAMEMLEKALVLEPGRPRFVSFYAWALHNNGQSAAAAMLAAQALNSETELRVYDRVRSLVEYGQILWSLGYEGGAAEQWEKAWKMNSNQRHVVEVLNQHDLTFEEAGDDDEYLGYVGSVLAFAEEIADEEGFEEAYRFLAAMDLVGPSSEEILYWQAYYAEAADLIEEAEKIYRVLIEMNPEDARYYDSLGFLLTNRSERLVEARLTLERALELSPEDPSVMDSLGWILYKQGWLEEAREMMDAAARLASADEDDIHLYVSILARYGEVLWESGMEEEAILVWKSAWELNVDYELDNEILMQTLVDYAEERNKYPGYQREAAEPEPGVLR